MLQRLGHRKSEAAALGSLGELEFADGNTERAFELLQRSAAMSAETGALWWQARMLTMSSRYAFDAGRLDDAERWGREALPLCFRLGDRLNTLYLLANLARCATRAGRHEEAGMLWGAVEAEEERARVGAWEDERPKYAEVVLAATGDEFARGRERARAMTLDEAVEYALDA
jgi:hypothetical protein